MFNVMWLAMACDSLFTHQCDMALAGEWHSRPQKSGYMFQEGDLFTDGHTPVLDAAASGTLFSTALAWSVEAVPTRSGRRLHSCGHRGSAINNDAAMKVGYAAPD